MALYTNTITTTWANLAEDISKLTVNTSITISDVNNVIFSTVDDKTTETAITLKKIITECTPDILLDFSPNDFSSNTNVNLNSTKLLYGCTKLSGMGKLPSILTNIDYLFCADKNLVSFNVSGLTNVTSANSTFSDTSI